MSQITLVTDQHDDDIGVGMIAQLLQPPGHVLVCLVLADVVNKQRPNSAAIVGRSDGTVSLLASRVPNLCLDGFGVDLDGSCGEFDTDGGLGVEVELVASESAQEVRLSDA